LLPAAARTVTAGGKRLRRTGRTGLAALLLALCAGGVRAEAERDVAPATQAPPAEAAAPFEIFGVSVPPGQRRQLDWQVSESFAGT
jgi:hypothetical protein